MSINVLNLKSLSLFTLASTLFAFGCLQAFDESEVEMKRNHAGCGIPLLNKCHQCPTGSIGPTGATGATGPCCTGATGATGSPGTPGTTFTSAYSCGFTANPFVSILGSAPQNIPINVDTINPPVNIDHVPGSPFYTIKLNGDYEILWTLNAQNLLTTPDALVVNVCINGVPLPFLTLVEQLEPFASGDATDVLTGQVKLPLVGGQLLSLQANTFNAQGNIIATVVFSLKKISVP